MMRDCTFAILTAAAVACGSPHDDGHNGSDRPTDSGQGSKEPGISCENKNENTLLYSCTARLESANTATAYLEHPNGERRLVESVQTGSEVAFTLWRMYPNTAYNVHIESDGDTPLTTSFTTPALPDDWQDASVTGTASFTHLLLPVGCGSPHLVVYDGSGRLSWYLPIRTQGELAPSSVVGLNYTEDDTVLAVLDDTHVREWSWTQDLLLELVRGVDFDEPVHHDVARANGLTLALAAEGYRAQDGIDYVMDVVLMFDGNALVDRYRLVDHFEPTGGGEFGVFWSDAFPEHVDWAHLNSIHPVQGDWLLSARFMNTVLRVRGDRVAPDFGEQVWAMNPLTEDGPLGNDFAFAGPDPANFRGQHHANMDADGSMLLFDNRVQPDDSRVSRWSVDPQNGSAALVENWSMGAHCPIQGSAYPLANGHVVGTCPATGEIREFAPGIEEPVWTLTPRCTAGGQLPFMARAIPLNFDP